MYGKTTESMHYMKRAANHSTKGSRRGFVDVETGIDPTDDYMLEQRRDSLLRKHAALGELRKTRLKDAGEYKRLGVEMHELQTQISRLNKLRPRSTITEFSRAFDVCARRLLLPADYERIAKAAREMMTKEPK